MKNKAKLALATMLAAIAIASPALAQSSFPPRDATPMRSDSPALTGGGSVGYNHFQDSPDHE
jgi:hypothetical protein